MYVPVSQLNSSLPIGCRVYASVNQVSIAQIMACRLFGAKLLFKQMQARWVKHQHSVITTLGGTKCLGDVIHSETTAHLGYWGPDSIQWNNLWAVLDRPTWGFRGIWDVIWCYRWPMACSKYQSLSPNHSLICHWIALIWKHYSSGMIKLWNLVALPSQIAKFMGPTWGPPGSFRPQMGPMLAPWTLL